MRYPGVWAVLVALFALICATFGCLCDDAEAGDLYVHLSSETSDRGSAIEKIVEQVDGFGMDGPLEGILYLDSDGDYRAMLSPTWCLRGNDCVRRSLPESACDSDADCEKKTDKMCRAAGHGGIKEDSATVTTHVDGSKTCSADCSRNGAVAFVICNPKVVSGSEPVKRRRVDR